MTRLELLFYVVVPYAAITSFVLGHLWRFRYDRFGISSRSTQLLERRWLRPGTLLFHLGLLAVVGGHVLGILIPKGWTEAVGISEHAYHVISVSAGTTAGLAMAFGFLILLARRILVPRVRATTSVMDWVTHGLLALVIVLGMWATIGENLIGGGYDYRETVAPWFRGLFGLDPQVAGVSGAPLVYRIHAVAAWVLLGLWPYSRLVHAWSVPLTYLGRANILYRSRVRPRPRPITARRSVS